MISAEELFEACRLNNDDIVRRYIAEGGCVNIRDAADNFTPLMQCAWYEADTCLSLLLAAGADINSIMHNTDGNGDISKCSALLCSAISRGDKCLPILAAAGADLNCQDDTGRTALSITAETGKLAHIRRLISAGADMNIRDYIGYTALTWALESEHYEAAQLLVELGVDIYAMDNDGTAAIDHCAIHHIKAKLIQLYQQRISTEAAIASSDNSNIPSKFIIE